jgi:hypothetical protein
MEMKMNPTFVGVVLMAVIVLLLAGCGAAQPTATTMPATEPPTATEPPPSPTEAQSEAPTWSTRRQEEEGEKATIWAYDYDTNTWTAIESTGGPSYRSGHTRVYHPGTDRIILFGGHPGAVEFSDETWAYDYNSNTWTLLSPSTHPSGRQYHTMVYAEASDKMVLFGGIAGNWLREEISDELWIFDPVAED